MSIKNKFISSVFYMALAKYSNVVSQLVITAILARLLTPDDFGTIAISTTFITFSQLLSDVGFSPAIIQHKDLCKDDLSAIFSICFYIGLIISLLIYLLSSVVANFYQIEILETIFKMICICCLFNCLNIVPEALLKKEKRFKFISVRMIFVNFICGSLAIFAAYSGLGIYSLLIAPILSAVIIFIINYLQNPLYIFFPTKCIIGVSKIFRYSMYQFMYNFLLYISRNLDKLVIGKTMGSIPLGYYEKSYHLMLTPVSNLSNVVSPTIQPFFADKQKDNNWMFQGCCKILHFLSLISFPLSVFCFFSAREIILLIFGEQWELAVMPFQILSLSVGFQVIYSPQGAFYQAANSTKRLFTSNIVVVGLNISAILIGAIIFQSLSVLCYAIVTSFILSFFYVYYILITKLYKHIFLKFLSIFVRPIILTIFMGFALYAVTKMTYGYHLLLCLVVKIIISAIVYIVCLYLSGEYKYLKIR